MYLVPKRNQKGCSFCVKNSLISLQYRPACPVGRENCDDCKDHCDGSYYDVPPSCNFSCRYAPSVRAVNAVVGCSHAAGLRSVVLSGDCRLVGKDLTGVHLWPTFSGTVT